MKSFQFQRDEEIKRDKFISNLAQTCKKHDIFDVCCMCTEFVRATVNSITTPTTIVALACQCSSQIRNHLRLDKQILLSTLLAPYLDYLISTKDLCTISMINYTLGRTLLVTLDQLKAAIATRDNSLVDYLGEKCFSLTSLYTLHGENTISLILAGIPQENERNLHVVRKILVKHIKLQYATREEAPKFCRVITMERALHQLQLK